MDTNKVTHTRAHAHTHTDEVPSYTSVNRASSFSSLTDKQTNANFLTNGNTSKPSIRGRDMAT